MEEQAPLNQIEQGPQKPEQGEDVEATAKKEKPTAATEENKDPTLDSPTVEKSFKHSLRAFLKSKKAIYAFLGLVALLAIATGVVFATDLKYPIVGLFAKGQADIIVTDSKTHQPIGGATVELGGVQTKTNQTGKATLSGVTLGKQKLTITKAAYASVNQDETIWVGINTLPTVTLEGTGLQVSFVVTDKLTGLPIQGATVEVEDGSTQSDAQGKASLRVLTGGKDEGEAKVSKDGFNNSKVKIWLGESFQAIPPYDVSLLASGKDYFLSNSSGKYNLYQSNFDGSSKELLVAGTGNETSDTTINVSPDGKYIALRSAREGAHDSQGNPIISIYILDASSKSLSKITTDPNPNIVDWIGQSLVFSTTKDNGVKMSYVKLPSKSTQDIGTYQQGPYTYFGSAFAFEGYLVYSVVTADAGSQGLYIDQLGQSPKMIENGAVGEIRQAPPDTLLFTTYGHSNSASWYSYKIGDSDSKDLSSAPTTTNKDVATSSDSNKGAFIDNRDGKSELYLSDPNGQNETKLTSLGSVVYPIRWIGSSYIIFEVNKSGETADYIIGADAKSKVAKITDVYLTNHLGY